MAVRKFTNSEELKREVKDMERAILLILDNEKKDEMVLEIWDDLSEDDDLLFINFLVVYKKDVSLREIWNVPSNPSLLYLIDGKVVYSRNWDIEKVESDIECFLEK